MVRSRTRSKEDDSLTPFVSCAEDARSHLLALASTCNALRQASIPCFDFAIRLDGPKAVVELAKVFGQKIRSSSALPTLAHGIQILAVGSVEPFL